MTFRSIYLILICTGIAQFTLAEESARERPPLSIRLGFCPGDAFFPVIVGKDRIDFFSTHKLGRFSSEDENQDVERISEFTFGYSLPSARLQHAPVYYFGYLECKIKGLTEEQVRVIEKAVYYASRESTLRQREAGMDVMGTPRHTFQMLIVNKSFPFRIAHFYNRYNEDWREFDTEKYPQLRYSPFGVGCPSDYQPHLWLPEAIINDWKFSKHVPELSVTYPEPFSKEDWPKPIYPQSPDVRPISVKFDDIAIVCIPGNDLEKAYRERMNQPFYVGNSDGVYRYEMKLSKESIVVLKKELMISIKDIKDAIENPPDPP